MPHFSLLHHHPQKSLAGCRSGRGLGKRALQRAPRGLTLIGLLFWAGLVACVGYLIVRTAPTVVEYRAVKRVIGLVAAANPATVADARASFDKQREMEYGITAVTGKDLTVTKENDKVVLGFSYDKEVPLYGPVRLLIKFEGLSSD
jgi:Domain of unknown function (DUF4845)